nr:atherin-like [Gorilla gorilla gorilla]XP_055219984.1 atherin-like [Gorilla gorilla gorilla]XP_055219985.1 atherin-like [Gorilla gorilla gorilla]
MGARGRVREETGRGGRRGERRRGRGRGRGGGGGGGGGRKLDKLGLYPRARVSCFRLPPGEHHRGDQRLLTAGALHRGRGMAAPLSPPLPPPPPPVSGRGCGGGEMGAFEDEVVGAGSPQNPRRTVAQGFGGQAFLPCPRGFLLRGPRAAAAPGTAPRHSPRRRRRSLPAPPPPRPPLPCQPRRQPSARSRTAARRRPHNTYRSAGGGVDQGVRAAGATGREGGARRGGRRGPAGQGSAPLGAGRSPARLVESRKTWGRCWREKENLREEEEEKPNLIIFGVEMGFGRGRHLQSK